MRRKIRILLILAATLSAASLATLGGCHGNKCELQSDCAGGQFCYKESCVAANSPELICSADPDCGSSGEFVCRSGYCTLIGIAPVVVPDAGPPDTGVTPDAGTVADAGTADAGGGGTPTDGGMGGTGTATVATAPACTMGSSVHGYQSVPSPTTQTIISIWAYCISDAWAVANGIYHWDGNQWSLALGSPQAQSVRRVWGSSWNDVYFVGGGGTILHWNGAHFHNLSNGTFLNDFNTVFGSSGSKVYLGGARAQLVELDGPDATPQRIVNFPELNGAQRDILAIWSNGASDVWIGGGSRLTGTGCFLNHFDGSSWSGVSCGAISNTVLQIRGSFSDDVWIVPYGQRIGHATSAKTVPTGGGVGTPQGTDIYVTSNTAAWLAGGLLYFWGGFWDSGTGKFADHVVSVGGSGTADIWLGGDAGHFYHGP